MQPRDLPESLAYLHGWFEELQRGRQFGDMGVQPFSYPMMESWARLTGRQPTFEEVEALFALDVVSRFPSAGAEPDAKTSTRQFPGAKPVEG